MDIKDVEKLAELAKIELNNNEKERLLSDMEGILGYVKQIESVDVPDVEPEYLSKNVWREDKLVSSEFSREEIISQFPDSQDGFV
ncbi:MAG: Asp-tRNA(Asn)/Glu-tRNA(Gln) amidotransferase subunit GatC, partial [Minisyncoccia bacterium]